MQPSYLRKSSVPFYDLIIIDSLHNILNPYFGINGSDLKSNTGEWRIKQVMKRKEFLLMLYRILPEQNEVFD